MCRGGLKLSKRFGALQIRELRAQQVHPAAILASVTAAGAGFAHSTEHMSLEQMALEVFRSGLTYCYCIKPQVLICKLAQKVYPLPR